MTRPVPFAPGATIVRRDVFDGRVWSACPARVLSDDGHELVFAYWTGTCVRVPASWIRWLETGDEVARLSGLDDLAGRRWALGDWTWVRTSVIHATTAARWFSVNSFFDAASGERLCWYVNFERPHVRGAHGIDTFDLLLDLVVRPDGSWSWKDEDELAHACRLGLVTSAEQAALAGARDEAIGLVTAQAGPFAPGLDAWRPDAAWPAPALPAGIEQT